jgi:hypothetical protein
MALGFAAIAAIGGLVSTGVTTGLSISDRMKAKKLQKQAEADADKAMEEAKKLLDVNVYEALNIQMKPYELEREAAAVTGAQLIEAGRESERGAAAIAGRVQAGQNELNRNIQTRMGQEMLDLQKLTAAEESRLKDVRTQLALGEVEGAQTAAAMYEEQAAQATRGAIAGVTSMIGQAAKLPALYGKNAGAEQAALGQTQLTPDQIAKIGNVNYSGLGTAGQGFTNLDLEAISKMSRAEYNDFYNALTPDQRTILYNNQSYLKSYDDILRTQSQSDLRRLRRSKNDSMYSPSGSSVGQLSSIDPFLYDDQGYGSDYWIQNK